MSTPAKIARRSTGTAELRPASSPKPSSAMSRSKEHEVEPIEVDQRLSRSKLWRVQREYFDRVGIEAWRRGEVPHYITNNPGLAGAYAEVFLGFFRDLRTAAASDEPLT